MRPPFNFWQRFGRLIHYKLIIPLLRSQHPPEFTARGVMVGVFWAFTPLIGVQMYLVGLTWLCARLLPKYSFNLLIALAWTWVTNVLTIVPMYYTFYITGQALLGNFGSISGYDNFVVAWRAALEADGLVEPLITYLQVVATEQGLPLAIGWIPYAFGLGWLGYRWSLKYVISRRHARAARIARKRQSRLAKLASRAVRRGGGAKTGPAKGGSSGADYDPSPT